MAGRGRVAALALALLVGCSGAEVPIEESSDLERLLPTGSEIEGWAVADGPVTHTPETLFEILNGGAERYLVHGFRELLHVRYQVGDDPLTSITLDVYDMGSNLGAFGIYSAARTPELEVRPWGAEGYRVGTTAAAWKGSVYVHGEADDDRPELIAMLEKLVAGACERSEGEASFPAVLAPLPINGRVPRSERHVPADLLGHSFLPGGILATYAIDGRQAELFYSDLYSEAAARAGLASFREHMSQWGTVEGEVLSIGDAGFRYTDPTLGFGTVARAGRHLAGIQGEQTVAEREKILAELVAALR